MKTALQTVEEFLYKDRGRRRHNAFDKNDLARLLEAYANQSRWIAVEDRLPKMDLDKAELFAKNTDYYVFTDDSDNEINVADASAFFLEGYKHALNLFELILTSDWKPTELREEEQK